jgi:diguanylate cyclase (GGDEF)-like protein
VLAGGSEGLWSPQGDAIEVEVPPRFDETPAFSVLALFALLLLLALGYRLRVRGLRRRQLELEREVDARTRELVEANGALAERTAQLEILNVELERLSTEDALTGLANRRQFDTRLDQEWRRAERTGTSLALINLDVDYFKEYNDAYGHPQGDACLQRLGRLLTDAFARASDLPARLGGDEFTVILGATSFEEAVRRAETLRSAFEALALPNRASRVSPVVTLSLGAAAATPGPGLSAEQLLSAADKALYMAKEQGKNKACGVPLAAPPA